VTFSLDNLGVQEAGLPLLRDIVHEHTGLFYDDNRFDILGDRLAPLVLERGFRSFLDFYYLLKYDDRLLPEIVRAAPDQPIRIWSVPCASGEEPLTIAMVLEETGWFHRARIEIHASDGSEAQIERARAARYRERSFRALPQELREKYFEADNGAFRPTAALQRRINSWSVVNLMATTEVARHARSPVIVCRNAFIYFSPQSVRRSSTRSPITCRRRRICWSGRPSRC
jgi:chemotaxis protein methyltransferase CheR